MSIQRGITRGVFRSVISSIVSDAGAAGNSVGVTTDVNGTHTIYYVLTTSATPPTGTQVKAGQDHLGAAASYADSIAATSSGSKADSVGTLGAGTYYPYFYAENGTAGSAVLAGTSDVVV